MFRMLNHHIILRVRSFVNITLPFGNVYVMYSVTFRTVFDLVSPEWVTT